MKTTDSKEVISKDVIIIGNGPGGIVLSYFLSGRLPYILSNKHPEEMLSRRLENALGKCLLTEDLEHLSTGLEGRSTNQVSLLVDALLHPYADVGLDLKPLIEFRNSGIEIDHIVLGKGPPGGSWHQMDPNILTLSLGSWMALPGLPFNSRDSGEKRAFASNVANYYNQYVNEMKLNNFFASNMLVKSVESIEESKVLIANSKDTSLQKKTNFISNAINYLISGNKKKSRCKRFRELDISEKGKIVRLNRKRSTSFGCDSTKKCDNVHSRPQSLNNFKRNSCDDIVPSDVVSYCDTNSKWIVRALNVETGEKVVYSCKYLVLANGASDLPNRLEIFKEVADPHWFCYDLKDFEAKLECLLEKMPNKLDMLPVLVIGAGLSAADAIMATRARNVPVVHIFRSKSPDLGKQLPEHMYPEYHKVYQMMQDGGSSYPLYAAFPEYTMSKFDSKTRTVFLTSKQGEEIQMKVSFAVILIGSRPDLSFLPSNIHLGLNKNLDVDCKTNPVSMDRITHRVSGFDNLYVIGPLAGDNFVRFLPGGALAVLSDIYKRNNYI